MLQGGKHDLKVAYFVLAVLLAVVGVASCHRFQRYGAFASILAISIYLAFFTTTNNLVNDYSWGLILFTLVFIASDFLVLTEPQVELHLVDQPRGFIQEEPLFSRCLWAFRLLAARRGIGWAHEPTMYLPPKPESTSWMFITTQLCQLAMYILLYDIAGICNRLNPCFIKGGPPLNSYGWLWRTTSISFLAASYAVMNGSYILVSIISVATHTSKVQDWPPLFGSWLYCATPMGENVAPNDAARKIYFSYFQFLTVHSNVITHKILRLPPNGLFQAYVKMVIVFSISGLIHYLGDYMCLQNWGGGSMHFFLIQGVAITFEKAIIALAARSGISTLFSRKFWRIIGYVWVWTWFSYCIPVWIEPLTSVGFIEDSFNFDIVLGLYKWNINGS